MTLCLSLGLNELFDGTKTPSAPAFLRTADGGYYLTADGGKIRMRKNH